MVEDGELLKFSDANYFQSYNWLQHKMSFGIIADQQEIMLG